LHELHEDSPLRLTLNYYELHEYSPEGAFRTQAGVETPDTKTGFTRSKALKGRKTTLPKATVIIFRPFRAFVWYAIIMSRGVLPPPVFFRPFRAFV